MMDKVFEQINYDELRKCISVLRSVTERAEGHTDLVGDLLLDAAMVNLDLAIDSISLRVWELTRKDVNHVAAKSA
jgi:hypothetical protein